MYVLLVWENVGGTMNMRRIIGPFQTWQEAREHATEQKFTDCTTHEVETPTVVPSGCPSKGH